MRFDQGKKTLPRHHSIHLNQEQFFAGLFALAGVLSIREGHLFHRKRSGWNQGILPSSGSLFQSSLDGYVPRENDPGCVYIVVVGCTAVHAGPSLAAYIIIAIIIASFIANLNKRSDFDYFCLCKHQGGRR